MELIEKIQKFVVENKLIEEGDSIIIRSIWWTRFDVLTSYSRANTKKWNRI